MNRFIRTKDGKIIDLQISANEHDANYKNAKFDEDGDLIIFDKHSKSYEIIFWGEDIVKQADTIEELIEGCDYLLECEYADGSKEFYLNCYENSGKIREILHYAESGLSFYTKQDRNYILVAEKVDGEWRVI